MERIDDASLIPVNLQGQNDILLGLLPGWYGGLCILFIQVTGSYNIEHSLTWESGMQRLIAASLSCRASRGRIGCILGNREVVRLFCCNATDPAKASKMMSEPMQMM
jgi:hypothetical protein